MSTTLDKTAEALGLNKDHMKPPKSGNTASSNVVAAEEAVEKKKIKLGRKAKKKLRQAMSLAIECGVAKIKCLALGVDEQNFDPTLYVEHTLLRGDFDSGKTDSILTNAGLTPGMTVRAKVKSIEFGKVKILQNQ